MHNKLKTAFFDCSGGMSGDMTLAALLDAGVDIDELKIELGKMPLPKWDITKIGSEEKSLAATKIDVTYEKEPSTHRGLNEITTIIKAANFKPQITEQALAIFHNLAKAEASVHGSTIEEVGFHEVGAVDAIIDIVGSVIALDLLGVEKVLATPLPITQGWVKAAHGILPVPAPAVLALIKGFPTRGLDVEGEVLTPTGAAIITTLASNFGAWPNWQIEQIGYGAGHREFPHANILRVAIGYTEESETIIATNIENDTIAILTTALDDISGEILGDALNRFLEAGAIDVYFTPITMKKNRPGTEVSVLCPIEKTKELALLIMHLTGSLGIRYRYEKRFLAKRRFIDVKTNYGTVKVKVSKMPDGNYFAPEFDDCQALAQQNKIPVRKVYNEALAKAVKILI